MYPITEQYKCYTGRLTFSCSYSILTKPFSYCLHRCTCKYIVSNTGTLKVCHKNIQ